MGLGSTVVLGLLAGVTILIGVPVGRLRHGPPALRPVLNGVAVGILVFLVWDVLSAAWEPIDASLSSVHEGAGGLGTAVGYGVLATLGTAVGLLSLVGYEQWVGRRVGRAARPHGPGAMAVGELESRRGLGSWSPARRLALLIAVGIGFHNFAEGLAIGQSSASGEIGLAVLLVVGFGLHNATEGFGIVAPLAADGDEEATVPPWSFLLALGAIGGGPTVIGTVIGHSFTSEPVSVVFLTLAAGSLLYVITQLIGVAARARRTDLLSYGLLAGLLAGFVTDAIVTAAGV
jgi:zinc transporter, ZIP family